jgi:hypothetical protein
VRHGQVACKLCGVTLFRACELWLYSCVAPDVGCTGAACAVLASGTGGSDTASCWTGAGRPALSHLSTTGVQLPESSHTATPRWLGWCRAV